MKKLFKIKPTLELTRIFLSFVILLFFCTKGQSQSFCHTPETSINSSFESQIKSAVSESSYTLRIYMHRIRPSNGIGGLTDEEIQEVYEILNEDFSLHGITFYWDCHIDNIDNTSHYNSPSSALFSINNHQDGIDIYLSGTDSPTQGGAADGVGEASAFWVSGTYWGTPAIDLPMSQVASHEMGHVLFLWHTFTTYYCPELVDGSNCEDCGDQVCDTPADPHMNFNVSYPECEWLNQGNVYDANNDPYDPDPANIMAYTNPSCMEYFTPGQGDRALNAIATLPYLQDCIYDPSETVTTYAPGTTVIDQNTEWLNDVHIESGATLRIEDCVVSIAQSVTVNVDVNAKLIIDNATLTSSSCNPNFWQGIELWGDSEEPQINYYSGYNTQGVLQIKNGGIIENAWVGVTTSEVGNEAEAGGIIDARDGEFLNNYIAVDMKPFQNTNQHTGNPKGNLSKFTETKFTVNDDYIGNLETEWPEAQVKMHGVDGVVFSGCEFVNTSTVSTSEKRSKGIFSEDANYRVQHKCASIPSILTGCATEDIIPSVFDGFYRGIEATKVNDALPIKVVQSQFKNNMIGVELADLAFSEIIKSEFIIGGHPHEEDDIIQGEFQEHLGIFSNNTLCFVIEENEFLKDSNSSWDEQNGVFVFNSGANSNNLYLNEFTDLNHGAIGYQVNRNENGFIGLQFTCNDMTDNFHDFVVSRTQGEGGFNESGIRTFQGNLSPNISAGNEFSLPNGVGNEYTHWDINSGSQYLYYHMPGEAPDLANEVTPNTMFIFEADVSNGCTSNYSVGHQPEGGISGVIGDYDQVKSDYYSTLYTYKQIIDDGDTEGTLDDIVETWPEDAWDLYNMLMARSPRNSETVLIAAADREIMPHAMLLEVLIANPDALRNGRVIYHVENNLNNPMPGYMIDILYAASDQQTLRTTMESTLAHHHAEMSRNLNFIIQHYTASDTLNGVHNDSLLYYLGQMDSPTGKYNLAGRLMRIGEITQAMDIIDSIPHNYKLTPYQTDEWKSVQAFFELLESADGNNRNIASLDSTELVQLEMIATDPDGGIGALRARKALCFFYQNCIPGPALPKNNPGGNKKPLPPLEELLADLNEIQTFPNPASEYVTFSFQFFKENAQREILIYNSTGSLVQNFRLDDMQEGQQLWDTRKMKPGTYIFEVIEGERKIHSGKIVIQ